MNPIDENTPMSRRQRLDLLVDGELGEAERRELLGRLDAEPGGWRRCALAFLEAQAWKEACGRIARESAGRPPAERPARRARWGKHAGTLLAMAASFLAALLLGSWLQGVWPSSRPIAGRPADLLAVSQRPEAPAAEAEPAEPKGPESPGQPAAPSPELWVVELRGPEGPDGSRPTIRLPAVELDHVDPAQLGRAPAAVPPGLLEDLERLGLHVSRRRELLPLRMQDGRRLVVPVDQVDIHYVGNPAL